MRVLAKLKMQGDFYNYKPAPTASGFLSGHALTHWTESSHDKRKMRNEMRMSPRTWRLVTKRYHLFNERHFTPRRQLGTGLFRR